MNKINGSIVLYNNSLDLLKKAIYSFISVDKKLRNKLYLIDNSPTDKLRRLGKIDKCIEYLFNNENLGFGKAHNVALRKSISERCTYHIVLNPDVCFEPESVYKLYEYMQQNLDVANIIPKTFYPDGSLQRVCKLLPSPLELIFRRLLFSQKLLDKVNSRYELHNFNYNQILNAPFLSGCFMFLRIETLEKIGLFDENIFMYMEDVDLNRRLHAKYRTVFYPYSNIIHVYARESKKNRTLLIRHIKSTIYYFNKYGWFFDKHRRQVNQRVTDEIKFFD